MKDKIPVTVADLAQRLIENDMKTIEELKKDNDVYILKNQRLHNDAILTMPQAKFRTKSCTRHEYTEIRRKDKDNIIFSTWVCQHCNKILK